MASSKSKTTQTTNTDMGPWKVQTPYLQDTFQEAQDLYNQNKGTKGYQGDFVAQMDQNQKNLLGQGINFFQNTGINQGNFLMDQGNPLITQGNQGALNATGGLYGLATGDATGNNINAAQRYASGLNLDALTDAATYGARRQAAEQVVPNMYRQNAATGNINSDRAALAQGVVERGLAENAQNIRTQLGADAYNTGLGLAQRDAAQRASDFANAGQLYGTLAQQGRGLAESGYNTVGQSYNTAADYGSVLQQDRQMGLDNAQQRIAYDEQRPFDLLNKYYGIVGANNWGQQGTQTTIGTQKNTPSGLQIAGGVISSIGSLFGGGGMFGKLGAFGS